MSSACDWPAASAYVETIAGVSVTSEEKRSLGNALTLWAPNFRLASKKTVIIHTFPLLATL